GRKTSAVSGGGRTQGGNPPVVAWGDLPDALPSRTPAELKILLMADRDVFLRGLTEKLLTYALGRGLERYDRPTVAAIVSKLPSHQYSFSGLVTEIVNSLPFQMRSAPQ